MNEAVNHPKHYTAHPSGIECIEVTRHMPFSLGNAFKYIFRHKNKNQPKQDILKALWYLSDQMQNNTNVGLTALDRIVLANSYCIYDGECDEALKHIYQHFHCTLRQWGRGYTQRKMALQDLVVSVETYVATLKDDNNE